MREITCANKEDLAASLALSNAGEIARSD